eukprot:7917053-Alexandrium_andersonii.AAC.1
MKLARVRTALAIVGKHCEGSDGAMVANFEADAAGSVAAKVVSDRVEASEAVDQSFDESVEVNQAIGQMCKGVEADIAIDKMGDLEGDAGPCSLELINPCSVSASMNRHCVHEPLA